MKTSVERFNGRRILGAALVCATFVWSVQAIASPPSFIPLDDPGIPTNAASDAKAVSADGSFVAGTSAGVGGAYRWSSSGGMVSIAPLPGATDRAAIDMSPDGGTVVGASGSQAFTWTSSGGTVGLGSLVGGTNTSVACGVSLAGDTIVGVSGSASGFEAFRWTSSGGMVGLGDLPTGTFDSQAFSASADGSVIAGVGNADVFGFPTRQAVRWTAASGYSIELLDFSEYCGGESYSWAVSEDGSTVVGELSTIDGREGFRWTVIDGAELLGDLEGGAHTSEAKGVSADGSLVVGASVTSGDFTFSAFVWSRETGMIKLQDILVDEFALDLTDWSLVTAQDVTVTSNGITFVGWGNFTGEGGTPIRAYRAHIPYLPAPVSAGPVCTSSWELAELGNPGLSTQAPTDPFDPSVPEQLSDLAVYDDGNGPALYA
ncbi:MAG: hypothetical protein GXP29_03820, partial [Planctomycetes bacterium]|nr:hypothetical protein [Planctomycetota bacterium]